MRPLVVLAALALALLAAPAASAKPRLLAFTKTAGFHHDSIPAAVDALRAQHRYAVDVTDDAGAFTGRNLRRYAAVVFLLTTGDVLDPGQQRAFEGYIHRGGGYAGFHSATDTEYDWPFYDELVGTHFASHPGVQRATIRVEDHTHPATSHLGINPRELICTTQEGESQQSRWSPPDATSFREPPIPFSPVLPSASPADPCRAASTSAQIPSPGRGTRMARRRRDP